MQVVGNETGVPPETLRSWEKRYGFPVPGRATSGHRRYSQRDIAAVGWLREQTERGQNISDAIAMLQRIIEQPEPPVPVPSASTRQSMAPDRPLMPVHTLTDALLAGNLADAQAAWDQLSLAISPDAILSEVLLPAWKRIRQTASEHLLQVTARSFLHRKAMVQLDRSSPEQGVLAVIVLTGVPDETTIPALALATTLSRSGYRLPLPPLAATSSEALGLVVAADPAAPVILAAPEASGLLETVGRLLPERHVMRWWPEDDDPGGSGNGVLPARLRDVPDALHNLA